MNGINSNNNTAGRLVSIKGRRMHRMIAMETASVDQEILAGSSAAPLASSKENRFPLHCRSPIKERN